MGEFVSDVITGNKQNKMSGKEKNQRLPFYQKKNKYYGKDKKGRHTAAGPAEGKTRQGEQDVAKHNHANPAAHAIQLEFVPYKHQDNDTQEKTKHHQN